MFSRSLRPAHATFGAQEGRAYRAVFGGGSKPGQTSNLCPVDYEGAESQEPRAKSREPGARSQEPGAESQEPGAESQEPRAESREPRVREPRVGYWMPARGVTPAPQKLIVSYRARCVPTPVEGLISIT